MPDYFVPFQTDPSTNEQDHGQLTVKMHLESGTIPDLQTNQAELSFIPVPFCEILDVPNVPVGYN